MKTILTTWIGFTDVRASKNTTDVSSGPISQAIASRTYDEICLISDLQPEDTQYYKVWLENKTKTPIIVYPERLSGPTVFSEIYEAVVRVVTDIKKRYPENMNLVFHISPGTPQMAAVWIILSKTRFPAELIESSLKHGVRTVSIPFDISADFIPDLLRKSDKTLERLSFGLSDNTLEFEDIIHRSETMQQVIIKARRIAPRSIPVLIEGESGTGKELFARAIHKASPRINKPFITINCGAIPAELVEAELFGHEKGSFTGASTSRIGHFEEAHEGTVFLDEIGELPKNMQVKLLRILQEGEVKRIGTNKTRKVDIRIIAATNRNLMEEVAADNFRGDLFYRLAVAVIKIPPLRKRQGDISYLVDYFLNRINKESVGEPGYRHKKISASAKNILLQHAWPGNVRELQNTLTRAAVWSLNDNIDDEDIHDSLLQSPQKDQDISRFFEQPIGQGVDLNLIIKKVAVHYLEKGLSECHGNKTKAAKLLGLSSYQTLTNWLKKYEIE
jgi:transcriptional regulator with PAS, ATPase and Fis domain